MTRPDIRRFAATALARPIVVATIIAAALAGSTVVAKPVALNGGDALDLARYRGKVVYVDFWASWCGPCKLAFPFMAKLAERHRADGLVIITVNVERQRPAAEAFLRQVHSGLPVVWDSDGALTAKWQVNDMPTSLVFNRAGKLQKRHQGFFPDKAGEYEAEVTTVIRQR